MPGFLQPLERHGSKASPVPPRTFEGTSRTRTLARQRSAGSSRAHYAPGNAGSAESADHRNHEASAPDSPVPLMLSSDNCLPLICSLILGLSVLWPRLIVASVVFFIVGMILLIIGVIFTMKELSRALHPVELESRFISEIADAVEKLSE